MAGDRQDNCDRDNLEAPQCVLQDASEPAAVLRFTPLRGDDRIVRARP